MRWDFISKNISVRKKMLAIFGVSVFFIGGMIAAGVFNMFAMRNASRDVYEEKFSKTVRIMNLRTDIEDARRALLTALIQKEAVNTFLKLETLKKTSRRIDGSISEILSGGLYDKEALAQAGEMKSVWESFKKTREEEILPAVYGGKYPLALKLARGVQEERFKRLIDISSALIEHETAEALSAQRKVEDGFRTTIIIFTAIALSGAVCALYLISKLTGELDRSLNTLLEAIENFQSGDLRIKIEGAGKDEVGRLAEGLNRLFRRLYEDRVANEQYISILDWEKEEKEKTASELALSNASLCDAQMELEQKNEHLEKYINELRKANQQLADTRTQMLQSEKMASIGQLAAGVAHEINNPIAFVSSNINTLEGYVTDMNLLFKSYGEVDRFITDGKFEEAVESNRKIAALKRTLDFDFIVDQTGNLINESKDGITRVNSIVQGLRDFSHEGNDLMIEYDINKCLNDTIKIAWHEIKYKAELDYRPGPIPPVLCRPQQINQVFLNMIINAVQAIPDKGEISIQSYTKDRYVVIEIKDSGTGIPDEIQNKIFDPFFTTKSVGQGTGLGLSIAYGIIREHKGVIEFESKAGEGTTFMVYLPIDREAQYMGTVH